MSQSSIKRPPLTETELGHLYKPLQEKAKHTGKPQVLTDEAYNQAKDSPDRDTPLCSQCYPMTPLEKAYWHLGLPSEKRAGIRPQDFTLHHDNPEVEKVLIEAEKELEALLGRSDLTPMQSYEEYKRISDIAYSRCEKLLTESDSKSSLPRAL